MKKICCILFTTLFLLFFSGCVKLEISGLENYRKQTCSVSLTDYLFPSEGFLGRYKYISGDYQYCDAGDIAWGYVTTIAYLSYTPEVYADAKAHCLEKYELCDRHLYTYNNYIFLEQLCHTAKHNNQVNTACAFPKVFNMFAYNDDNYTLVFLGYYNGNPDDPEKQLAELDFPSFIEKVYLKYFEFSK